MGCCMGKKERIEVIDNEIVELGMAIRDFISVDFVSDWNWDYGGLRNELNCRSNLVKYG